MKALVSLSALAATACGPSDLAADDTPILDEPRVDLAGDLPAMARLSCDNREYRLFFSEGVWDWRDVRSWSSYRPIGEVSESEIELANGPAVHPSEHYSLVLDRSNLVMTEHASGPNAGMTVPNRPRTMDCAVAEAKNV